jgi:hypothetical protein
MEIGGHKSPRSPPPARSPKVKVMMRLGSALGAGLVEAVGGMPEKEEDLLCLIMPLRLPDGAA